MDCFNSKEIDLLLNQAIQYKLSSFSLEKIKKINFSHRHSLINQLKKLTNSLIAHMPNHLDLFYLSVLYLDIILSRDKLNIDTERSRMILAVTCFNLALKFDGIFDMQLNHIIRGNISNYKKSYVICENKCLLLLNYNLFYTTIYDFINLILYRKEHSKILYLAKSILYSFIGNECVMLYPPFLISVAIIKFSKECLNIKQICIFDKYFNHDKVNEICETIKKEYNSKENEDDAKNWDVKTMSSTVEEYKENNKKMNKCSSRNSVRYNPMKTEKKEQRVRNNSVNNTLRRNVSFSFLNTNLSTVNNIQNKSDKINIDLGQMSKMSFNKLAKLSIRYFKQTK